MSLFGLFDGIFGGPGEPVGKDEVDGLIVSTVLTRDMGYETAIIDAVNTYPVERYDSEEEALAGHACWVAKVPGLTEVNRLGYGDWVDDLIVKLEREDSDD